MYLFMLNSQEFLTDERFWAWVKDPTDRVLNQYWQEYQRLHPEQQHQLTEARKLAIHSLSQADFLTKPEMNEIWKRINHSILNFS